MQAQPDPSDSLVFECDFDEPPEKLWRALTEPRLLEAWLTADDAPRTTSDSGTGGALAGAPPPQTPSGDCELLTAEPHRLLRYRWRDREDGANDSGGREVHSIVTVELAPCPTGGTHLRLTHGEFTIVSAVPTIHSARITPIMNTRRRRAPILSCAGRAVWRRAA
jgi:uncharacterized protein YndB with AHSA1/START domain